MFETRYRVARDKFYSRFWAVQYKKWWWPSWVEFGSGLLTSKEEALELIECLKEEYIIGRNSPSD